MFYKCRVNITLIQQMIISFPIMVFWTFSISKAPCFTIKSHFFTIKSQFFSFKSLFVPHFFHWDPPCFNLRGPGRTPRCQRFGRNDPAGIGGVFWGVLVWWFSIWMVVTGTFGLFFHILGMIIPTDFHIFQRGWNHQPDIFYGRFIGLNGMILWVIFFYFMGLNYNWTLRDFMILSDLRIGAYWG